MLPCPCTNQCQHYYTLENTLPLAALGLNAFTHSRTYQASHVFPPRVVSLLVYRFHAEPITGVFKLLILVVPCWIDAPLTSHISQHVGRHSLSVYCLKFHHGCLVDLMLKGLPSLLLTVWLLRDVYCTGNCSHPQSVRPWWQHLKCLQQKFTHNTGENNLASVLNRVY